MSDSEFQVFISSKMAKDALQAERNAAIEVIKRHRGFSPWHWETCGYAAPYPPMEICLEAVRNSDILILLLGYDLTDHTREEHELAVLLNIPDLIFVRHGRLKKKTREYLDQQEKRVTYWRFKSLRELKTMIAKSVWEEVVRGYRKEKSPRTGTSVSYSSGPKRRPNG